MKTKLMRALIVMIFLIIPFLAQAQTSDFEIRLTDGSTVTVSSGDKIKFAKLVDEEPAMKHPVLLGTLYNLHLDNGKFDENGVLSYDEITGDNQDIIMDHTEIRYNLVVSVEWDAKEEYLQSVNNGFRKLSNYLYDVTDGQVCLDTIYIGDDMQYWNEADIRIRAHNSSRPVASINGANTNQRNAVMLIPRKWYGDIDESRNGSYDEVPPIDYTDDENIRMIAHELGHYLFGFEEEYEFFDNNGRCSPLYDYGLMDGYLIYQNNWTSAMTSEMSSGNTYIITECQNTRQFVLNQKSCWDQFEEKFEGTVGPEAIYVPILKPTISDETENVVPATLTYMPGPNNDLSNLDYDVGARMVTPIIPTMSTAFDLDVVTHDWQANRLGNIKVVLRKLNMISHRDIEQGFTADVDPFGLSGGGIYVLGAETNDKIMVSSDYNIMGISRRGFSEFSSSTRWYSGEVTVGATSDSLEIELKKVEGNYPLVINAVKDSSGITFDMLFALTFSELPTIEIPESGGQYLFSASANSTYTVSVSDSLNSNGTVTIYAKDANSTDFFFNLGYDNIRFDSASSNIIEASDGLIRLERSDTSTQDIFIVSSPYLVMESNLPASALKIGECYSIWKSSNDSLRVTIRYTDADLYSDDSFIGYEDMIQLYMWNSNNNQWEQYSATLDTVNNSVTTQVSSSAIFALFSSDVMTDIADNPIVTLPNRIVLNQNYPNPFNPSTEITFSLPTASDIKLEVYNTLGQKVTRLLEGRYNAGVHQVTWDGSESASGVYFFKLITGDFMETKKMLLLK